MNQGRKTIIILANIIFACIVLVGLLVCGSLGYINSARPNSKALPKMLGTNSLIKLNYCYDDAPSICIVSFGQDSVKNSLIVINNANPSWSALYLRINETGEWKRYECQKVQFSSEIFYCSGTQLQDNGLINVEVYAKNNNHLIASGLVKVSVNGTPTSLPRITKTPVGVPSAATPGQTLPPRKTATAVSDRTPIVRPSRTPRPSPTSLYPNP
jgi:hypothetical protein